MFDNTPYGGMNIVNFPFICSNCIYNTGQKKKYERTKNNLQNIHIIVIN
jgi:hypothetical protein